MQKHVCDICGWVYDPAVGATAANVPAGTEWKSVSDDFACPECGAGKDSFSALE